MVVRKKFTVDWLLLTFTLPTKRASQRVEIWRKLQRYGTVPLGNSGYLLPNNPVNEERFQWLPQPFGNTKATHPSSMCNRSTIFDAAVGCTLCGSACSRISGIDSELQEFLPCHRRSSPWVASAVCGVVFRRWRGRFLVARCRSVGGAVVACGCGARDDA